ncbi:MAG: hypothetical protein P8L20_09505 [Flavobacteriales bacterium]|nr:hypothetical protein [Flavobacteriales bacterium]
MNRFFNIITVIALLMLPQFGVAQNDGPRNKAFEKAEKKKEKQKGNADKIVEKHHKKIQDKETLKRMKKTKKKAKRYKNGKFEDPFYKKWFRKK